MGRVFFDTRKRMHSLTGAYDVLVSDSNKEFILNAAAGAAIALPSAAALGEGWHCKFIVGTAFATSNWQITATAAVIRGVVSEAEIDDTEDHPSTVAGTTIDFVHSLEKLGDYVELTCDGTNIFMNGQTALDGAVLLA